MLPVFDNFLPDSLFRALLDMVAGLRWKFGAKSNSETDPHGHWSLKPFHDKKQNLADLTPAIGAGPFRDAWLQIQAQKLNGRKLIRAYWNGYCYGTDGYFHRDSDDPRDITALLYVVPEWDDDWAGETIIETSNHGHLACIPKPNRLLLFPSNARHCARAVSRKCPALRSVMVLKNRPAGSEDFEKLSAWLVANKALTLKHGKHGTLHDHLLRCYGLCEARKLPNWIRRAAGLHSVYGTNAFHHRLFDPTPHARAQIASVWGADAENLVCAFSILDRPRTLEGYDGNAGQIGTAAGQRILATMEQVRDLRLVEAANLADQASLDQWPAIKATWEAFSPKN